MSLYEQMSPYERILHRQSTAHARRIEALEAAVRQLQAKIELLEHPSPYGQQLSASGLGPAIQNTSQQ